MKAVRVLAKANVMPKNILGAITLKSISNANLPYRSFSNQPPKGPKIPQGNPAQGKVPNPAQNQPKTPVPQQANSLAVPDALKKELYGLISKQAEVLVKEESANELSTQLKQYLEKTGFQLSDNVSTGFSLTKETPAMRVYISFEPAEAEEQVDTEDFAEGLQEDAAKEKDIVEEGGEEDGDMDGTKGQKEPNIVVRAEITFLDRTKEPKGVLFVDGFAGYDNRLYVETMMISEDATPKLPKQPAVDEDELTEEMPQGPAIRFDELAQPIQDKMYDLLDSVNIDDNLAAFIRGYLANYPTKNQIEFFDKFKKLLS